MSNPNSERDERVETPERIYIHPTSSEYHLNKWPLEEGEYVEYVRAELLDSQAALTGFGKPEDEARRILTYATDWIGNNNYRVLHGEIVRSIAGLQSQLDKAEKERDDLRVIVNTVTDDDPGTALSKLHKIQHDAATRMRDRCVEKVRSTRDSWATTAINERRAASEIITAIQSLTLEGEQEKQ